MFVLAEDWSRTFQWGTNCLRHIAPSAQSIAILNPLRSMMKKRIVPIMTMLVAVNLQAQASPLPFQWHGQTNGIVFRQTNLTDDVKASIRDDIELVMSRIAISNVQFIAYQPGQQRHDGADGIMTISEIGRICPSQFPLNYYFVTNGMTRYILDELGCSIYSNAVALTNQCADQIASIPTVMWHFTNGFDVANMTLEQKKMYIWNPELDKLMTKDVTKFEADISEALPKGTNWITFVQTSILSFSREQLEDGGNLLLTCRFNVRLNRPGNPVQTTLIFVYKDGAWRWCPEIL